MVGAKMKPMLLHLPIPSEKNTCIRHISASLPMEFTVMQAHTGMEIILRLCEKHGFLSASHVAFHDVRFFRICSAVHLTCLNGLLESL